MTMVSRKTVTSAVWPFWMHFVVSLHYCYKYGSIDDSEQPPRSSRSNDTIYPGTVGEHPCPPQQNKDNVRDPAAGSVIPRRLAVMVMCGLTLLAGSGMSWIRSSNSRTTCAAAVGFLEVRAYTDISGAETRPTQPSSVNFGDDVHDFATLEFTALNFYDVRDGKPGQDYPWLKDVKLIETYRDTTLAVVGPREGFSYRWARAAVAAQMEWEKCRSRQRGRWPSWSSPS